MACYEEALLKLPAGQSIAQATSASSLELRFFKPFESIKSQACQDQVLEIWTVNESVIISNCSPLRSKDRKEASRQRRNERLGSCSRRDLSMLESDAFEYSHEQR
jgi:hypothetical protein